MIRGTQKSYESNDFRQIREGSTNELRHKSEGTTSSQILRESPEAS